MRSARCSTDDVLERRNAGPPVSPEEARRRILSGEAGPGMRINGHVDLANQATLAELPERLSVTSIDLSGCTGLRALPRRLEVKRLNLGGCTGLRELPPRLRCYDLDLRGTRLRDLPDDLRVEYSLDLSGCTELRRLPPGLSVGTLLLRGCTRLEALPEGLDVCFLDISGCTRLTGWPEVGSIRIGRLVARGCTGLRSLPPWLTRIAQVDVRGCVNLRAIPDGVEITSWLDLAGTAVTALPATARVARLHWGGVPIDERIAFRPQTITADEVLATSNVELRRVLLERMGYERFLREADARVLDRDRDPGGERRLLMVRLHGDEPLVCVAVFCPSTGRRYVIRVPPETRTCRQAVAWMAGFDDPEDYRPVQEA